MGQCKSISAEMLQHHPSRRAPAPFGGRHVSTDATTDGWRARGGYQYERNLQTTVTSHTKDLDQIRARFVRLEDERSHPAYGHPPGLSSSVPFEEDNDEMVVGGGFHDGS
eukprot:1515309-Amphidinium_carterae.1